MLPDRKGPHRCGARPPRPTSPDCAPRCIWTGGLTADLGPSVGYHWPSHSLITGKPDAPLNELQDMMRSAEARLVTDLADAGWQVVLDGPLSHLRSLCHLVAGYVKTHHRQLFPDDLQSRIDP